MSTREKRQEATFSNWINAQFARANRLTAETKVTDLAEDLKSGVRLIKLMNVLCPSLPVPKYNQNPKMRFAQMENLNRAFNMLASGGIKIVGIGADNVADGNIMMILGLVWSIIYNVRIGAINISEDGQGKSGREGLLYWCQKQTASYKINVTNFTSCWRDGLALSAIIHHNRPDVLDFEKMKALGSPRAVVTECVRVAEEQLGIPHLLEVDDILIADDEKVIMAFISEFFALFSKQAQVLDAVRRARTFLERQKAIDDMVTQFEADEKAFKQLVDEAMSHTTLTITEPSLEDAWQKLQDADKLRERISKEQLVECQRLIASYDNIQLTSKAHSRKPYKPSEGILGGQELRDLKTSLGEKAWEYVRAVRGYYTEQREKAERQYVEAIEELDGWLRQKEQEASDASGSDVDQVHRQLSVVFDDLASSDLFGRAQEAVDYLERNGIPHYTVTGTHRRWDEICWKFGQIKDFVSQKKAFAEAEKAVVRTDDVTQSRLDEYLELFKRFDVEHSNTLGLSEFVGCLKGLGIVVPDEEVEPLFEQYAEDGQLSFQNFIKFMKESTADSLTKDQVLVSFRTIAQQKPVISNEALKLLGDDLAAFCLKHFPETEGGLDYSHYLDHVYDESHATAE
eukprot:EG_transcript_4472